ncbi:MAG: hypothetical protein EU548_09105 [Promethearchaeota archaeon]|nr:MAG: hypothetical protein EU548_09105 [Candidatus Lokiarchaeota archaeon]
MNDDVVQIKLTIQIPKEKWLAKFNKKYSELSFQIMSKFLLDEKIGMTLFHIKGVKVKQFLKEFKESSENDSFQILFEGEQEAILNVKTIDPWILSALVNTELPLAYPINIKNSKLSLAILSNRQKIDSFLEKLENKAIQYTIQSVGYYRDIPLLTKKQSEMLKLGLKLGYFNIPRSISLSNLAERVNVSPSALSEMLRRIDKKLAKNYFMQKP